MKKRGIIMLGIALLALLLGAVLAGAAAIRLMDRPRGEEITGVRTDVSSGIVDVVIDVVDYDVIIAPRRGTASLVESMDSEKIYCEVTDADGKLTIKQRDERKWYERLFDWQDDSRTLRVWLPDGVNINSLDITTTSGDVGVSGDLLINPPTEGDDLLSPDTVPMPSFTSVRLCTTSGDIKMLARSEALFVHTTSGDVEIENMVGDGLQVTTTSGDVTLENCAPYSLELHTTSGDIDGYMLEVQDRLVAKTTSGEIALRNVNAGEVSIRSTSGDVHLYFMRNDHYYVIDTTSGEITRECESDQTGKRCGIETTSGDVYVAAAE